MGRALLLICSGMIAVFGIMQLAMQDQYGTMGERNADYAYATEARNIAFAGIELGIDTLTQNPAWTGGNFVFKQDTVSVSVNTAIDMTTPVDTVQLTAVSVIRGDTSRLDVIARKSFEHLNTDIYGAMGTNVPFISPKISGTANQFNGNDTNFDGTAGPGDPVYGLATSTTDGRDAILTEIEGKQNQREDFTGVGGTPSIEQTDALADQDLTEKAQFYSDNADYVPESGSYKDIEWGTEAVPQITVIEGDVKVNGTNSGTGILLMKENSKLNIKGDFNFKGLIIQLGPENEMGGDTTSTSDLNTKINGNITLYGGMVIQSKSPGSDLKFNMKGNVHVNYSTQGLGLLETIFRRKDKNGRFVVTSWYE